MSSYFILKWYFVMLSEMFCLTVGVGKTL